MMNAGIAKLHEMVYKPAAWVFLLALSIRTIAVFSTHIINPDGILYIQQARAIFYGEWDAIIDCGPKYLSILPPLISLAFAIVRDWEWAGRLVSLVFGFAALIPLYYLIRRFFNQTSAALTLLVYAFIPALVGRSADVIRDPVFWFLLCCGLLVFIRRRHSASPGYLHLDLPLSCMLLLLSAWARIEGVLFIALTAVFLMIDSRSSSRRKELSWFLLPVLVLGAAGLSALLFWHFPVASIIRVNKVWLEISSFFANYGTVRDGLAELARSQSGPLSEFLKQARESTWIVPIGGLINCLFEKFFYPYMLIFLAGFIGIRERLRQDTHVLYFMLLCIAAVLVLYIHLLNTWLIFDRFIAILIFPAVLFVGFGCQNILDFLQNRFGLKHLTAIIILTAFITAPGVGKNIRPRYDEKKVFRQIAAAITLNHPRKQPVRIAALPSNAYQWVYFYANKDVPGVLCARTSIGRFERDYDRFIDRLRAERIRFVLWSATDRPPKGWDLMAASHAGDFKVLGTWDYEKKNTFTLLMLRDL